METLQPVNIFLPSQPAVRRTVTAAGAAMMVRKTSEVETFKRKSLRSKLLNENVWGRNVWIGYPFNKHYLLKSNFYRLFPQKDETIMMTWNYYILKVFMLYLIVCLKFNIFKREKQEYICREPSMKEKSLRGGGVLDRISLKV